MMDTKDKGTVPMQCTNCRKTADYSPLRLGRTCGQCKQGRWIPKVKETEEKLTSVVVEEK